VDGIHDGVHKLLLLPSAQKESIYDNGCYNVVQVGGGFAAAAVVAELAPLLLASHMHQAWLHSSTAVQHEVPGAKPSLCVLVN
jgi:hypothetical protein